MNLSDYKNKLYEKHIDAYEILHWHMTDQAELGEVVSKFSFYVLNENNPEIRELLLNTLECLDESK